MRVERIQQSYQIAVAYRHFPLHPETPAEGLTLEELFAGKQVDLAAAKERMSQLMFEEGLPYGLRTMTYNSRLAQELAKWAEAQVAGERIHGALFEAYFVNNINLAQPENLVSIASQIGLPTDEATRVLNERSFRSAVDADWERSRQLGITGVPTFIVGSRGIVGAQSYDELAALVRSAGAAQRDTPT